MVFRAVSKIPKGRVKTYKDIANEIGYPKAYRAVGTALCNNPFPVIIPCHRVVKSNGELGKYFGKLDMKKQKLLESEGIIVKNGLIDLKKYLARHH